MQTNSRAWGWALAALVLAAGAAAGEAKGKRAREAAKTAEAKEGDTKAEDGDARADIAALRLLKKAEELLEQKDLDRGLTMLENVLEQYPKSKVRYQVYLALGKHHIAQHDQAKALKYLQYLGKLKTPDQALEGEDLDLYLQGLYYSGLAFFETGNYGAAFQPLRTITNDYPNTVWGNQAHYYIGMCHFHKGNWDKAIKELSLVGTFVDPDSETATFAEAGRRFFLKVEDADLPVLQRQGKDVKAQVAAASGDVEAVPCVPLTSKGDVLIGSLPSAVGVPKKGDGILQVIGGDTLTVTYLDDNSKDGAKNSERKGQVKVVSTARLAFTQGTYKDLAEAAFLNQPLFVLLQDADLDKTPEADAVAVRMISRFKAMPDENAEDWNGESEERWEVRDEVTLSVKELGEGPVVRTGQFGGSVKIVEAIKGQAADRADDALACMLNDEIVATFIDERHIGGETSREVSTKTTVIGEMDNRPAATQPVIHDPLLKANKELRDAQAFLELGRIFKSMGLRKGAGEKCDEGLTLVDPILKSRDDLPTALKEQAFKLKWEFYIVKDDLAAAIQTCELFNKLFPDSPFADQALMGIAKIRFEAKEFAGAQGVFAQVLRLKNTQAQPEAMYMIARCVEAGKGEKEAIVHYKACAEKFPQSEFAGESLAKLVDYYVKTRDFVLANDLLEQVFQDYPDASFLDSMLLKWVIVAFRKGDYATAREKCNQLIFEYPASSYAENARKVLPKIEEKLQGAAGGEGGGGEGGGAE
ncbi:MAG: tetratricopeptide repeat protein [Planctomycetes bacterium]|nr:tetratricopeptide repeat protein [Planctomycetota bacterium]